MFVKYLGLEISDFENFRLVENVEGPWGEGQRKSNRLKLCPAP